MTGEMMTPDGSEILPKRKTHTFPYCMIMEWEKSQIRRQRNYGDLHRGGLQDNRR